MRDIYKLEYKDLNFWKLKDNTNLNDDYYEKVNDSGNFFLRKAQLNIDGMNCNYEEITTHQGVRIREKENYYILEPSNITIPKSNIKTISDTSEIVQTSSKIFRNICIDTFICNLISDFTRGGKNRISEKEVEQLRSKLINSRIGQNIDDSLSSIDFMFMFSSYLFKNKIYSFERDKIMDYIFSNQDNPKYKSILERTKVYRHEHYDVSQDLESSIACLKYIGILYPNYEKDNPYEYLCIDDRIVYYSSIYDKKISQFPEMNEFLNNYKNLLEKNEMRLRLYKEDKYV